MACVRQVIPQSLSWRGILNQNTPRPAHLLKRISAQPECFVGHTENICKSARYTTGSGLCGGQTPYIVCHLLFNRLKFLSPSALFFQVEPATLLQSDQSISHARNTFALPYQVAESIRQITYKTP